MRLWRLLVFLTAALLPAYLVRADELKPAYVEMTETAQGEWDVRWKASARSALGRSGKLRFPKSCAEQSPPVRKIIADSVHTALTLKCRESLAGKKIGLAGLSESSTDALIRISPLNGEIQTLRLTPGQPVQKVAKEAEISNVASTYTLLGIEHILGGFDHLLFVLCLVLLLKNGWLVVKTVTAFTLAHSITLIGASLGYFSLPPKPVEAVIALSIIFLAVEIVKADTVRPRLSEQYPWVVAFLFGLLHGFGFAGALAEIGLPRGDVPLALLTFNLGVELGQLTVVGVAFGLISITARMAPKFSDTVRLASAYAIGSMATYWFLERMLG